MSSFPRGEGQSLPVVLHSCLQLVEIQDELAGHDVAEGLEARKMELLFVELRRICTLIVDSIFVGVAEANEHIHPIFFHVFNPALPTDELEAAVLELKAKAIVVLVAGLVGKDELYREYVILDTHVVKGVGVAFGSDEVSVVLFLEDVSVALLLAKGDGQDAVA